MARGPRGARADLCDLLAEVKDHGENFFGVLEVCLDQVHNRLGLLRPRIRPFPGHGHFDDRVNLLMVILLRSQQQLVPGETNLADRLWPRAERHRR